MSNANEKSVTVSIVSDVVCPWCIVGYRQLETALKITGVEADITWQPFELNPQMPPEGQNLAEHIAEKYGSSPEDSARARTHLTEIGAELGFVFNFTPDMRMHNTFIAHQLLHWAHQEGRQHELKMALFTAYFTQHEDLSDPAVLARIAASIGLDHDLASAVLSDGRYAMDVREEQQFWTGRGIQGVPAMIFNQRHLVTGAQGVENYTSILRQLTNQQAA